MADPHKYTLLGFWWMVLRRSIFSWHQLEGLLALASYLSIIWLGASSFGVFEQLINDTFQTFFSVIAILWLIILIVFYTPYKLWKETAENRDRLRDIKDYETAINKLSELFDEGNNKIFNPPVMVDGEYNAWFGKWKNWASRVEGHLETNFGLREKNLFKNLVLVEQRPLSGYSPQYIEQRNQVAKQLEIIRDTIIRHSDRLQRWRAENI